jgi:hypothetical protein
MYEFTEKLRKRPLALLKFADELWKLESLQKGNLYMNTLRFFKELEEKAEIKGMGDKNEGSMILTELDIKIYNNETNELVYQGPAGRSAFTLEEDLQKHALCLCYLDYSNLEIYERVDNYLNAKIIFTDEQKEEFRKSFGKHVLVMPFPIFVKNLEDTFNKEDIAFVRDIVKYDDFSINNKERLDDFMENKPEKYFWKDNYFETQREYRVIVLNRDSDEPFQINIGDISNNSFITSSENLFNHGYCVQVHFNPETDLVPLED